MFERMKQRAFDRGVIVGRRDAQLEAQHNRYSAALNERLYHVGRPVIHVPNEWENPVIGFGAYVDQVGSSPVLFVDDLFTGKTVFSLSSPMEFSEQRLIALSKLDPYERWALFAKNACGAENFDKPKSGHALLDGEFLEKVYQSDFWEKWLAFKESLSK